MKEVTTFFLQNIQTGSHLGQLTRTELSETYPKDKGSDKSDK